MPRKQRQTPKFTFDRRTSGLLLHPTSLPGPFGSGDLGPAANEFADFLAAAGQKWWQMLPVGPPGEAYSPYSAQSAFAGSRTLISPALLADDGLLARSDVRGRSPYRVDPRRIDHPFADAYRGELLRKAFRTWREGGGPADRAFQTFVSGNAFWLDDYALFGALKAVYSGAPWSRWRRPYREREPQAIAAFRDEFPGEILFEQFCQFQFDRQWQALRVKCAAHAIGLIGDIPIFVAYDSAEVWANPRLFLLDAKLRPTVVSGCPPDAFCADGQRWGHPHYDWKVHAREGYRWWVERFRQTLRWFDAVRIDHFLGFHRVWHVRASSSTARGGRYVPGPGPAFFERLREELGDVPIIAEDLGAVVPEALALRDRFNFPGMRVLQFGFGGDDAYHLPHSYPRRAVAYTGTHDNDTTAGWFRKLPAAERKRVLAYVGDGRAPARGGEVVWPLIRAALASVADTAIFPVQDLLALGSESRMNTPGTVTRNWAWRLAPGQLTPALAARLRAASEVCGRA